MFRVKPLVASFLFCFIVCVQCVRAQDDDNGIKRPHTSGIAAVDDYMKKAFDIYDEVVKLNYDIDFYRVEIREGLVKGSTVHMKVMNGSGEPISKEMALERFELLLGRLKKQTEQIGILRKLEDSAAIERDSFVKKMRTSKEFDAANDAKDYVVDGTQKQIDLLNKYINTLKSDKTVIDR